MVVLSSCSVANAKVVQGGSLLGLANAFTTLGAASVIAPLTPISDAASVTVMDRLHREIVAGADPAAALAAATMTHDVADPDGGRVHRPRGVSPTTLVSGAYGSLHAGLTNVGCISVGSADSCLV